MSTSEASTGAGGASARAGRPATVPRPRAAFIDRHRWLVWAGLGLPLVQLLAALASGRLGVNPVETLTHGTGEWALRCLLLSLSMTPLRLLSGWTWPVRLRRALGVWAFIYALCHFTVWWLFDHQLDLAGMVRDVAKRPWITIGFTTLLLLAPLALTSTNGMVKRIGALRWKRLHRLAYATGTAGVLHFWWLVKADVGEPALYAGLLALGFVLRARSVRTA
jgi:sulfoxide reductase heme-binding subunit YedZ